jgi:transposase
MQQTEQNVLSIREGPAAKESKSHVEEVVADKGYHSSQVLQHCQQQGLRTYISEPQRGRRKWNRDAEARRAVYSNRRRIRQPRGKKLLRRRGELLERPFAHRLDTGAMRRAYVRGQANVQKREYLAASAQNLGLLMRHKYRMGTPRSLQDLGAGHRASLLAGERRGLLGNWHP